MRAQPVITIRTPEGASFSLLLAGPVYRFLAAAIDLGCIMTVTIATGYIISILGLVLPDIAGAISLIMFFIFMTGYGIIFEWMFRGQTPGKHLMRLRVMDIKGLRLNFSQIAIRNLIRIIDSMPVFYMAGGICCLISSKRQRLGDIAANTVVIRTPVFPAPDIEEVLTDKYNSLRGYPHLAARLRQKASPFEADLALQALLRRDELDPASRIKLFRELARHFKNIVEFPREAYAWISDEQYIRNVVEILFRSK